MNELDDDLMDDRIIQTRQEDLKAEICNNQTKVHRSPKKNRNGLEKIFKIIYYCVDGAMLLFSISMMNYNEAYPLVFSFGLVIWMGYRMLFFKRNKTVDVILGLFLVVAAVGFYIWAFSDSYSEPAGRIMIPTVYLGYFCAWEAIRRKDKETDGNDK
jgi:multidrug transporter EmrE-like cation transporter